MHSIKRHIYVILGSLSLIVGIVGVFIPLLPTTPFLLLASFCYLRSSERMYNWLMNHKIFGAYIYCYLTYKAVPKKTKFGTIIFLWSTLIFSMIVVSSFHVRIFLFVVGLGVSAHLLMLKTMNQEDLTKLVKSKQFTVLTHTQKKESKRMSKNKTIDNLMEAFAGESQANRKYLAYSRKAEKDGKINAAKLFKAASDAETIHALKHFEVAGKVGSTAENLQDGIAGETYEYKEMYPDFVKEAEEAGNKAASLSFTFAMKAEEVHAGLYQDALENLDQTEEIFYYLCPVCGNIEKFVPEKCSICGVSGDRFIKY